MRMYTSNSNGMLCGETYIYLATFNKPSADGKIISLVYTCTENGLSDGTSEMTVNDITPSSSNALIEFFRN